jgi:hypothetical protein
LRAWPREVCCPLGWHLVRTTGAAFPYPRRSGRGLSRARLATGRPRPPVGCAERASLCKLETAGQMTALPCEACGRPRGRGARCKECGYDRYATRLKGSRAGTSSQLAVTPDSSRPQASSSRTATPTAAGGAEVSRPPHEPASSSPVREQPAHRQAPHRGGSEPAPSHSRQSSRTSVAQPSAPVATGRVVSLSATPPASGDRPWWVAAVHALSRVFAPDSSAA